jgi:hypothetical protein
MYGPSVNLRRRYNEKSARLTTPRYSYWLQSYAQGGAPPGEIWQTKWRGNGRPNRPDTSTEELNLGRQCPGNSKISGYVIDSAATIAVEYATIAM